MSTKTKNQMREIMNDAWRMFKVTGESFADCLKRAWQLFKMKMAMKVRNVQFFYMKVNGEIRQAFGTLRSEAFADTLKGSNRKPNEHLFTYFDCEKQEFRSFKKFNLINVIL